jgi:hypothetical protein
MGEGFSAIPRLYGQKLSSKLEEAMVQDESRTNICALFFVKKGFPFVSVLNGGFCAAHSWLVREGSSRHLNASSVLIDYEPDNSLFGQMERLHNASSTEKAKRNMQYMLEKSLVAVTLKAQQLEKNLDQNQGIGNLRLGQIFGGGGLGHTNDDTPAVPVAESVNGDETAPSNLKGFKNPFARGAGDTAASKEEGHNNIIVPQFLHAFGRKQASDTAHSGEGTTTTGGASTDETTKPQLSAEKGSTTTATPATATSAPPVTAANPFAMFRQGKVNDEPTATAAASPSEKKPPVAAAGPSKPAFRGLGSWKAQAAAASSTFRFGAGGEKKENPLGANSFAGLNSLRKSTFARMRSSGSDKRTYDTTEAHHEESIAFD